MRLLTAAGLALVLVTPCMAADVVVKEGDKMTKAKVGDMVDIQIANPAIAKMKTDFKADETGTALDKAKLSWTEKGTLKIKAMVPHGRGGIAIYLATSYRPTLSLHAGCRRAGASILADSYRLLPRWPERMCEKIYLHFPIHCRGLSRHAPGWRRCPGRRAGGLCSAGLRAPVSAQPAQKATGKSRICVAPAQLRRFTTANWAGGRLRDSL
jgi:hypothetical protein